MKPQGHTNAVLVLFFLLISYWQDIETTKPKIEMRFSHRQSERLIYMVYFPHWYQAGVKEISVFLQ